MKKRLMSAFRIVMFGFLPAGALSTFAQSTAIVSTLSTPAVMLNQSGFYPFGPKLAAITGEGANSTFVLVNAASGDTVFMGNLKASRKSTNSSTVTRIADFSSFTGKGQYRLVVPGAAESYPFAITDKVHQPLAKAAMKAFYFQRVSMPLVMPYAGKWARPAGHPDTAVRVHPSAASRERPAGTMISSPGGWYDAGDYNKYIVNSGITMGTLLTAYEDYSTYFDTSKLNIPESGNNVPDILDEILYNLRWMLTMQDPNDGGVYNKCTNAAFDGTVMPGVTKLPRYVVQKGTAATLDFAAVTAQAARIFARFERQLPGLADSCAKAAKFAWKWSLINPALRYNQDSINQLHEPKLSTGGYGDRNFEDEWFWAASELLVLTGDSAYLPKVRAGISKTLSLPSWPNVHQLGVYTLIRQTIDRGNRKRIISEADGNQLKSAVIALADQYLNGVTNNAFLTVMGGRRTDFNWGSNSNAGNQGILMVNAWRYTKDRKYAEAALSNLDYLCGRNATGYSFITGIGTKTPMHPHHRPSMADNIVDPVPGLLAGGPNPGMQDKCVYEFKEPETAYVDHDCSYASNEIAINWNAPLVYLANAVEAIQKEAFGAISRFRSEVISNEAYETAAVFDVDHDGAPDIVSGAWWYAGPAFKTKHKIGEVRKEGEFYDDFSTIPIDVNNDGYLDFVTGGWWGNTVRWRENPKGKTIPWPEHIIAECDNVETTRAWDIDNDGQLEIVPNNPGKPLRCFKLDKKTGTFTGYVLHEKQGHGFGFGDINGDGRGDFVLPDGWLEAPANPWKDKWKFHSEFRLGETGIPVIITDLNKDGKSDLIVGQGHGYGLDWYEQRLSEKDGKRSWIKHSIDSAHSQFHTLMWEDIDGDRKPDLITGKRYRAHDDKDDGAADDYGLYYYTWNGKAFDKHVICYGPKGVGKGTGNYFALADLRNTGRKDIVVGGKDGLWVFFNEGNEAR